jgi:hypothetical protein
MTRSRHRQGLQPIALQLSAISTSEDGRYAADQAYDFDALTQNNPLWGVPL